MSLNPPLFEFQEKIHPRGQPDEVFILVREGVSFQGTIPEKGKYKSKKGKLYITNQRLIFCPTFYEIQNGEEFQAFEIPLEFIKNEKFNQPILGPCNLTGVVTPTEVEAKEVSWKISFNRGGTGVVLRVFLQLMKKQHAQDSIGISFVENARHAFVDPSDPTTVYVTQPTNL